MPTLFSSPGPDIDIDGDALLMGDEACPGFCDGVGVNGVLSSSWRRKETYAFTNAEGLNLGRQMGSQEADAEELMIDGEWIVLTSI